MPEEARSVIDVGFGKELTEQPALFKGPASTLIKDAMGRYPRLNENQMAYTTLIPWLLPKGRRYKPNKDEVAWAKPALDELIERTNPQVIVTFGKVAFDSLVPMKINANDARGGWFSHPTGVPVFLMDPPHQLLMQPWRVDTLLTDFREVNRMVGQRYHGEEKTPVDYRLIRDEASLARQIAEWREGGFRKFSVDCEWHGTQFVDGQLRMIQFCWEKGVACCLEFYDENGDLHLGRREDPDGNTWTDYKGIGQMLDEYLDHPDTTYIGHQVSADSPWMEQVLGMKVLGRFSFDSAYALQTTDEYAELGLEQLALRYTDFGRYDMPLVMWKRDNRKLVADGYGKIPTEVLFEYSCQDCDVVFRAQPFLEEELERQNLLSYYRQYVLPLVHEGFHEFVVTGLPVDRHRFEAVRKFMNWAYDELLGDFRKHITRLSWVKLSADAGEHLIEASTLNNDGCRGEAIKLLKEHAPEHLVEFWASAPTFNIRSHPQLRLLLFDVLGLEPVRTTGNNPFGLPGMPWERALELPPEVRDKLIPACDKETMEIMVEHDTTGTVSLLLAVNNVGNQCKGFLKEGDVGPDGEVIQEHGLAAFIASDDRIHGNFSLTETCRPSFSPHPVRPTALSTAFTPKANSLAPAKALRDGDGARKPKP